MEIVKLDRVNNRIEIFNRKTGLKKATYIIGLEATVYEQHEGYYEELDQVEEEALNNKLRDFYKEK